MIDRDRYVVIKFVYQQYKHYFITRREHVEKKARAHKARSFSGKEIQAQGTSHNLTAASTSPQLIQNYVSTSRMNAHSSAQVRTAMVTTKIRYDNDNNNDNKYTQENDEDKKSGLFSRRFCKEKYKRIE